MIVFKKAAFGLLALIWLAGLGLSWPNEVGTMVAFLAIFTIPYMALYWLLAVTIRRLAQ